MSGRVDDLVARLRHSDPFINDPISLKPRLRNPDGPEASDEIERLRARVAELEATVNEWAGV